MQIIRQRTTWKVTIYLVFSIKHKIPYFIFQCIEILLENQCSLLFLRTPTDYYIKISSRGKKWQQIKNTFCANKKFPDFNLHLCPGVKCVYEIINDLFYFAALYCHMNAMPWKWPGGGEGVIQLTLRTLHLALPK